VGHVPHPLLMVEYLLEAGEVLLSEAHVRRRGTCIP
jgi:hypothetical protein